MPRTRNLNFLPQRDNLELLRASTLVALLACGIMTGFALRGDGQRTATIGETVTPTPVDSRTPTPRSVVPTAISENPVNSIALGTTGDSVRYYEQQTGLAFSVDLPTRRTDALSTERRSNFIRAYWIPQSSESIIETRGSSVLAPSPDGRSLAYVKMVGDTATIFISAIDGSSPKKIFETRTQDVRLEWPSANTISLDSKRADRPGRDLSLIDLAGNLSVVMTNRENLELRWSPAGSELLFSYFSPEVGISLWHRDAKTGIETPLRIATSAQKCAWHQSSSRITCGIPSKSGLTRDVSADHSATVDDIATIDIATGQKTQSYTAQSGKLLGVIDPLVSPSERYFVFTNIFDQRLYMLPF